MQRDVSQRYDLKDSNTEITLEDNEIIITTASDMTLKSIGDILLQKATKRKLSLKIFDFKDSVMTSGNRVKQSILLKRGLVQDIAKKLSKAVRDELKKVTVSIQGETLRVTSKNKDDLQSAISIFRSKEADLDIPLQFQNYR